MGSSAKLALEVMKSDKDVDEMLLTQLKIFLDSDKCCKTYPKFYNLLFRQKLLHLVENCLNSKISLKSRVHEYNGLKFLKLYKPSCSSYYNGNKKILITENSKKAIYKYLHEFTLSLKEKVDLCPGFQKSDIIAKPRIQIYHFSMAKQNNISAVPPKSKNNSIEFQNPHFINGHRDEILKSIEENQVLIITYDIGIDKLTIPQFVLDNAHSKNEHCRIIYSNSQKLIAVKNSKTIAKQLKENVGLTVGYQIPLKSVSSCNKTNLLFTSTTYFLRCLMGVNSKDAFYGMTHVILDDVQERDFKIDLLLFEIREILSFYPNLKILLLCLNPFNTKPFVDYFKNVKILNLKVNLTSNLNFNIYYLNKILKMINYMTPEMVAYMKINYNDKKIILNDEPSQIFLNNLLDRYITDCDIEVFDKFCYLVQIERIPVDIQHSEYFMNMLMGAAKNNKLEHLKLLLKMNANIYLTDCKHRTAQDWAKKSNSVQCIQELQKVLDSRTADEKFPEQVQCLKAYRFTRTTNFEVDHRLIFELIKFLNENCKIGTILIIVPNYDDMLKIQYSLENYFKNKIMSYKIFKVHKNNKISELDEMLKEYSISLIRKIIFSTQIIESFYTSNDVTYIIDSGLTKISNHRTGTQKVQWISKDRAERRKNMTGISSTNEGTCFRLYTSQDYSNFPLVITPELMHTPLDNVCLFVKVLSPYTTIKEYFTRTICTPSNGQIENSINLLKTIGALEEQESITSLGMRLVDIPLPVQLGKVLIFGIFMQCLDPVLTIISILHFNDRLVLSDLDTANHAFYLCMENLPNNSNSDHLAYLRIFQKWQDDRFEFIFRPMSESQFILDQNLQVVCEIRSEIVGIVRSAQLIHANGLLSMNYINSCANNWAMVKACFVAGMYPNICHIQRDHIEKDSHENEIQFKCNTPECIRKMFLFPGSVLRNLAPDSWNAKSNTYQTDWLFYQNAMHREKVCRIHNNSLITPITIAIFAGSFKKTEVDIIEKKLEDNSPRHHRDDSKLKNLKNISIDDWISFQIPEQDVHLIFNLRQKLSHILLDLLQNCDNPERLQRYRRHYIDKLKILGTLSEVLENEELNYNFPVLERIGERPKALPLSCSSDLNISENEFTSIDKNFIKEGTKTENHKTRNDNICEKTSKNYIQNKSLNFNVGANNNTFINNYLTTMSNNCSKSNFSNNSEYKYSVSNIKKHQSFPNDFFVESPYNFSVVKCNNVPENEGESKSEILKYITPNTTKFYILPCLNRNDATEYTFKNKINKNTLSIWNDICSKFVENERLIHYVFLFDSEETCFCYSGFLIWNGVIEGIRLRKMFKVDFTLDDVIGRLKSENRNMFNFVSYVGYGEIKFEFGYDLMRCMEIFETNLKYE